MRMVRDSLDRAAENRDPIHRWFFKDNPNQPPQGFEEQIVSELININQRNDPHSKTTLEKEEAQELFQPQVITKNPSPHNKACKTKRLASLIEEPGESA